MTRTRKVVSYIVTSVTVVAALLGIFVGWPEALRIAANMHFPKWLSLSDVIWSAFWLIVLGAEFFIIWRKKEAPTPARPPNKIIRPLVPEAVHIHGFELSRPAFEQEASPLIHLRFKVFNAHDDEITVDSVTGSIVIMDTSVGSASLPQRHQVKHLEKQELTIVRQRFSIEKRDRILAEFAKKNHGKLLLDISGVRLKVSAGGNQIQVPMVSGNNAIPIHHADAVWLGQ